MPGRLVTVHAGPLWEIQLLRGQLEEEGIPVFVPDENTKRVDPFITGGFALAVSLQVPEALEARAQDVLRRLRASASAADDEVSRVEEGTDPEGGQAEVQAALGRRIRWAALTWVTAPLALVLGLRYLRASSGDGVRPAAHALTLTALLAWWGVLLALVLWLLGAFAAS